MKTIFYILPFLLMMTGHISCTKLDKEILYVGTFSQRESQGIYVYQFDRSTGTFDLLQTMSGLASPNFLVVHPGGGFLYAVGRFEGEEERSRDQVASFSINPDDGTLTPLNQMPTYGRGTCHVSMDHNGRYLFVSHYQGGSLSVFRVNEDGTIGDSIQTISYEGSSITPRQRSPHVHSILVSPDNRYVYVADLGTDKVMIYALDETSGKLVPATEPYASANPGSGPRHFTFHPEKPMFYLAEELSSSVTVFRRDESTGALSALQTLSTLPPDFDGRNTVADIHTNPEGRYLYVSNRGHNSIAVFSIMDDGRIESAGYESVQGDWPRNFMVDPEGEFLLVANQNSDNIVLFQIDTSTGLLQFQGVRMEVPAAVCLKWHKQ